MLPPKKFLETGPLKKVITGFYCTHLMSPICVIHLAHFIIFIITMKQKHKYFHQNKNIVFFKGLREYELAVLTVEWYKCYLCLRCLKGHHGKYEGRVA
jgi:hypothetical protein